VRADRTGAEELDATVGGVAVEARRTNRERRDADELAAGAHRDDAQAAPLAQVVPPRAQPRGRGAPTGIGGRALPVGAQARERLGVFDGFDVHGQAGQGAVMAPRRASRVSYRFSVSCTMRSSENRSRTRRRAVSPTEDASAGFASRRPMARAS